MKIEMAVLALLAWPAWADSASPLLLATTAQEVVRFVEQNKPPDISSTTLVIAAPPPIVHLPEEIIDRNQWRGVRCAVTESREAVFRHADKWRSFWERGLAPYSSRLKVIPQIDFNRDMVVGVFLGDRETPNHEVEILSIKPRRMPDAGSTLVVRYREIIRMEGVFVPPFKVQPYHLRRVALWKGPIVFEQVKSF